jgi:hypothetical protein
MKKTIVAGTLAVTALLASTTASAKTWGGITGSCGRSISGADGNNPWVVGCGTGGPTGCKTAGDGTDYPICWYDSGTSTWYTVDSGVAYGSWVSTGYSSGVAYVWVVNSSGNLYLGSATSNTNVNFSAVDGGASIANYVTASASNPYAVAYIVSNTANDFLWDNTIWIESQLYSTNGPSAFSTIGTDGTFWATGLTLGGNIYYYDSSWVEASSPLAAPPFTPGSVSGGASGTAYMVDEDGNVEYWDGSSWATTDWSTYSSNGATQVSVGTNGNVWALDSNGEVWTYQ